MMKLVLVAVCGVLVAAPRATAGPTHAHLPRHILTPQVHTYTHDAAGVSVERRAAAAAKTANHFYLWTRSNAGNKAWHDLDPTKPDSVSNSTFASRQTYIIIHGFLGWGLEGWILDMKDRLLNVSDCNVISVDWPAGTEWWLPSYYNAVGRVPLVGHDTASLILLLVHLKNLVVRDIHLVGHSLGAHISGLAAKKLKSKVGRISGLDPAGLTFHNVPGEQRLDQSDAEYVDVIHTNGCTTTWKPWTDCYGINENLGHSDFWPNGGEHQPGCQGSNGDIGCDHELAYTYFLESIRYGVDDTYFLARNCSEWQQYEEGECPCGDQAQYMGFYANPSVTGVFYLNTSTASPYAVRDSVCSPGSATDDTSNVSMVAACSGVSGVTLVAVVVGVAVKRRRAAADADCGLMVEEEEQGDDALINA